MNTNTNSRKWSWIQLNQSRAARTAMLLLSLLTLPAVVQAQFNYTINNGTITITGYIGPGDVVIPDTINGLPVTTIGDHAFYNNQNVASVSIPDSVTTIGNYAFSLCPYLTRVTLGNRVTSIGDGAFMYYKAYSIALPDSVTSIGDGAFSHSWIQTISLGAGLGRIGNVVFEYSGLLAVTIPDSVTSIGTNAFYNCALTSVTIGRGVTNISDRAFGYCDSLRGVICEGTPPSLGTNVFTADNNATVYYMPATAGWGPTFGGRPTALWDPEAQFSYTVEDGKVTITGYTGPGGDATIPDAINGLPVTNIGDSALQFCGSLTGITIPDSVTSIGTNAFYHCGLLTSVTIGSGVTNIGDQAFAACERLSSVMIPDSVINIGQWLFINCGSLMSVTLTNGLIRIGSYAFAAGSPLPSITIPSSVTSIGDAVCVGCAHLTNMLVDPLNCAYCSVGGVLFNKNRSSLLEFPGGVAGSYMIPEGVTNIADSAFAECYKLTSVAIPNTVTTIGAWAFAGCGGLSNITIPNSVTTLGGGAFNACGALARVTLGNSITCIGDTTFYGCDSLTSIMIPNSVTNIGWDAFAYCGYLKSIYFLGNAPSLDPNALEDIVATVYYLPGTSGWGTTFGSLPTALWVQPPTILSPPRTQTAEAGSAVSLRVQANSPLPLFYFWYLNATSLLSSGTNWQLDLPKVTILAIGCLHRGHQQCARRHQQRAGHAPNDCARRAQAGSGRQDDGRSR